MNPPPDEPARATARPPGPPSAERQPIVNAPPIVLLLIIALFIVFLLFALLPDRAAAELEFRATLAPARLFAGAHGPGGLLGALAPLFTHIFIHTDFVHFVFNAVWLLALGAGVARRTGAGLPGVDQTGANLRFFVFFVLCGLAGGLAFVFANPAEWSFARGASGAVSGLLGAVVRFALRPPQSRIEDPFGLSPLASRPVLFATLAIVATNVVFSDSLPGFGARNIAWEAHLGGYFAGLVTFPYFALRRPA